MPSANPKRRYPTGFAYIHNFHGFGMKRTQKMKSDRALKRYVEEQSLKLKHHFDLEIAKVKDKPEEFPLAVGIEFSNVNPQEIVDSLEGIYTVPEIRTKIVWWSRQVIAIARDLEEEIKLVTIPNLDIDAVIADLESNENQQECELEEEKLLELSHILEEPDSKSAGI